MSKFKHAQDRTEADLATIRGKAENLLRLLHSLGTKHQGILTIEDIEDLRIVRQRLEQVIDRNREKK